MSSGRHVNAADPIASAEVYCTLAALVEPPRETLNLATGFVLKVCDSRHGVTEQALELSTRKVDHRLGEAFGSGSNLDMR